MQDPTFHSDVGQFAKHIKLEEAVDFLGRSRTGLGVGTPARLMDLLDNGELAIHKSVCPPQQLLT